MRWGILKVEISNISQFTFKFFEQRFGKNEHSREYLDCKEELMVCMINMLKV